MTCRGNLLEYPGEKWAIGYSGKPILLRVQMKQAKLFGFEFME